MDTSRRAFLQSVAVGIAASSLAGRVVTQAAALDDVSYIQHVYRSGAERLPPGVYRIDRALSLTGRPEEAPSFRIYGSVFNLEGEGDLSLSEPDIEMCNCISVDVDAH